MTRYVVDATIVVRLASDATEVQPGNQLLAPPLVRSQVLSVLHESVTSGHLSAKAGLERLQAAWQLPIRLLGDAVLRRRAWDLATTLAWADTYAAEYLALTQLQGDAFITLDEELARMASTIVTVATFDDLTRSPSR
jgi:predicted nucleic acid-binding protein